MIIKVTILGCAGYTTRAGSGSAFSFGRASNAGSQSRSYSATKGRGKHYTAGAATTVWDKVVRIWGEDEINGGDVAKADGVFASEFASSYIHSNQLQKIYIYNILLGCRCSR